MVENGVQMDGRLYRVCLVLPCYREQERLPAYLPGLVAALADARFESILQVVDDGSPSESRERLLARIRSGRRGRCEVAEPLVLSRNTRKAGAVWAGQAAWAEADARGFLDADGAFPAEAVREFLEAAVTRLEGGAAAVWARRQRACGAGRVYRRWGGRVFSALACGILGLPHEDTQSGLKLFSEATWCELGTEWAREGFCFDLEMRRRLRMAGVMPEWLPVTWTDRPGGSFSAWAEAPQMLGQMARMRFWGRAESKRPAPSTGAGLRV